MAMCFSLILPQVCLLAACGPLPRPFEQQHVSALLSDQRALAPLAIQPIDGAPGLAEALVTALDHEDIAASTGAAGHGFQILSGTMRRENGLPRMTWRITGADGHAIGETSQPLQADSLTPQGRDGFAAAAASAIAHALRGDDSGVADLDAAPHVALRGIQTPADFDGDSLSRAMSRALSQQGMTIDSSHPAFVVLGTLKVGPTLAGQNLVTVDWTVQDAVGRDLGTVSQGSPVPHDRLFEPPTGLVREIATAGAEGIREVIAKQSERR
jgi:hypothetical protein